MAVYSPRLVANAFLYKARQSGVQISHMKLQKLVFFMHAWSLAFQGASFVSERPEAWTYGPVFDSLYHDLKTYGAKNIDSYLMQMDGQTGKRQALMPILDDRDFWNLLDQVWDRYGGMTAIQLSTLTHEPGGPWERARHSQSTCLSDDAVKAHYAPQLANG